MTCNLSAVFTNRAIVSDDALRDFLAQIKIRILGYGIKRSVTAERVDDYILPSFLLVYYHKGSVEISHAEQTTEIAAGSFYLHEPFEVYRGTRTSKEPLELVYVNFDITPMSLQGIFKYHAFHAGDAVFQNSWYSKLGDSLLEFCHRTEGAEPYPEVFLEYAMKEMAAYILYDRLEYSLLDSLVNDSRESVLIDRTFAYIEQHLAESVDIGQMLQVLGTSRSTLYRVFLRYLKTSPSKAITQFKIEHALRLIQMGCSITEIAKVLGYSSVYHFSNTFKQVMGKRPTEYKKGLDEEKA